MIRRLAGIAVECPFPMAGAMVPGAPDLVVTLESTRMVGDDEPAGTVLAHRSVADRKLYTACAMSDGFLLRLHRLCDFELDTTATTAVCHPHPDADPEILGLVTRGALLAFVLGLRGSCVLHASAVEVDGSALLFVGDSGMGKSTLAAMACALGPRLVADDLVRVTADHPPRWIGSSADVRLRPGAAQLLPELSEAWGAIQSSDGRTTLTAPLTEAEAGTVTGVVIPHLSRDATTSELRRLDPIDATVVLGAFPRLAGWRHRPAADAQLAGVAALAESVPVWLATVPWGAPAPIIEDILLAAGLARRPVPDDGSTL